MLQRISFLLLLACLLACGNNTPSSDANTAQAAEPRSEETMVEKIVVRYRSDGFYPGMASEWLEVTYNADFRLLQIDYWNTADETKQTLSILEQSFETGEISGYVGKLAFPGQAPIAFGSIEDRFNLIHDGDRFQEFELEEEE